MSSGFSAGRRSPIDSLLIRLESSISPLIISGIVLSSRVVACGRIEGLSRGGDSDGIAGSTALLSGKSSFTDSQSESLSKSSSLGINWGILMSNWVVDCLL